MGKLLLLIVNTLITLAGTVLLWGSIQSSVNGLTFRIVILYLLSLTISSFAPLVLTQAKKIRLNDALGISLLSAIAVGTFLIGTAYEFRSF